MSAMVLFTSCVGVCRERNTHARTHAPTHRHTNTHPPMRRNTTQVGVAMFMHSLPHAPCFPGPSRWLATSGGGHRPILDNHIEHVSKWQCEWWKPTLKRPARTRGPPRTALFRCTHNFAYSTSAPEWSCWLWITVVSVEIPASSCPGVATRHRAIQVSTSAAEKPHAVAAAFGSRSASKATVSCVAASPTRPE